MSAAPTPASPLEALKAGFRRACVRRLVGDEEGAVQVLRDEIPGLVVGWAKSAPLDPSEKKAKLKEMFDDESARADELAVAFDLFAGRFESRVAELVRAEVASLVNRFDRVTRDLTGVIEQAQGITSKLNELKIPAVADGQSVASVQENSLPQDISIPENDKQVTHRASTESERTHKSKKSENIEKVNLPADDLNLIEEPPAILAGKESKDMPSDLDPPSGTGLRFDEIEEMIDEILSYESK